MTNYFNAIALIIYFTINTSSAAKILAWIPMPAISHQAPFRPITQELARQGHEVTVITPLPAFPKGEAPKNLREIDVHEITYRKWKELLTSLAPEMNDDMFLIFEYISEYIIIYSETQLMAPEVQALINDKNETFDLVLTEHALRPPLVLSHLYKVPVIQISSFGVMLGGHELVGGPTHPLLYPTVFQRRLFNLTMWEKINALYIHYYLNAVSNTYEEKENAMLRKLFGDETPPLSELKNNIAMLFLNVHPIWEDNRPVPPNVVYLGGIHQKPPKELPEDLKLYLDSSEHGVIYFSLGTSVNPSVLPPETIRVYTKVFSELPYDVLWKYDTDELPGKPNNVRIEKWVPQADLLRHPKVKLFITQAGLQSTDEAITAGVPMVAIPMLVDQWYNAERYIYHKIGVKLDKNTITEESFKNAIETVINDESYRQNIEKIRDIFNDQPQRPLERAVWWTEYVLRHGGANHLRSPAFNLPWTQYYEIQLVSVVLTCLLAAVLTFVYAVNNLWQYIQRNYVAAIKIKKV